MFLFNDNDNGGGGNVGGTGSERNLESTAETTTVAKASP